ncbi:sel1-repeat-containing protein ybeq [Anaeramoeba flamelloides]|uniref:Sel1-repeat-containing protein ybeq n=1 Tax=Anaeramoeba flamelloides TaxID=1746091 RepID=A0ABQ8Z1M0_9EUKA|nr:sel1-repeat-containing protein ybeq [Anaeramoeba flamelloides]
MQYQFEQGLTEVRVKLQFQKRKKESDFIINLTEKSISLQIGKNHPTIEGTLFAKVVVSYSDWELTNGGKELVVTLEKESEDHWDLVIKDTLNQQIDSHSCFLLSEKLRKSFDQETAFKKMEQLAYANHIPSLVMLARIYAGKNLWNIKKDLKKSFFFWKKATDLGNYTSQMMVGLYYFDGIGCEKNYKNAIRVFKRDMQLGFLYGSYLIALIYSEGGYGITKNDQLALSYFLVSAKNKNVFAFLEIAIRLIKGITLEKNTQYGIQLLEYAKKKDQSLLIPMEIQEIVESHQSGSNGKKKKKNSEIIENLQSKYPPPNTLIADKEGTFYIETTDILTEKKKKYINDNNSSEGGITLEEEMSEIPKFSKFKIFFTLGTIFGVSGLSILRGSQIQQKNGNKD